MTEYLTKTTMEMLYRHHKSHDQDKSRQRSINRLHDKKLNRDQMKEEQHVKTRQLGAPPGWDPGYYYLRLQIMMPNAVATIEINQSYFLERNHDRKHVDLMLFYIKIAQK